MGEIIPFPKPPRPLSREAQSAHDARVLKVIRESQSRQRTLVALSNDMTPENDSPA